MATCAINIENKDITSCTSNVEIEAISTDLLKDSLSLMEKASDTESEDMTVGRNQHNQSSRIIDSECSDDESQKRQEKNQKRKGCIIDSDSDDEAEGSSLNLNEKDTSKDHSQVHIKQNIRLQIESDPSDDEAERSRSLDGTENNQNNISNNEDENNAPEEPVKKNLQERIRAIVDSESSDEEDISENVQQKESITEHGSDGSEDSDTPNEEAIAPRDISNKIQRKSAKQAQENMLLIQSESQRMSREAEVSVPYHRPRQCTLQEFLGRRNIRRPTATGGPVKQKSSIHMRGEELLKYAKHLEERAKEAELFFKSRSDDETECTSDPSVDHDGDVEMKSDDPANEKIISTSIEANRDEIVISNALQTNEDKKTDEDTTGTASQSNEETSSVVDNTNSVGKAYSSTDENTEISQIILSLDQDTEEMTDLIIEVSPENTNLVVPEPIASTSKKADELLAEYEAELKKTENEENSKSNVLSKKAFQAIDDSDDELEIIGKETAKLTRVPVLSDGVPRLSGGPGMFIDLEDDRVVSQGVGQLMQRFVKHAKVKPPPVKPSLDTVSKNGEGLTVVLDESQSTKANPVPGLALQRLRNELQARMAQRRSEEFTKRQKQQEEEKSGYEADILDDEFEENEELELSSSEDEEDELDGVQKFSDNKKGALFLDKEAADDEEEEMAEDADDEDEHEDQDQDEDDAAENPEEKEDSDEDDHDDEDGEENEASSTQQKRTLKRIQILDSSDSEAETETAKILKRNSTDLFASQNVISDDDTIPPHQTKFKDLETTPQFKASSAKESELNLLSPALFPADSEILASCSKYLNSSVRSENDENPALKCLFSESSEKSPKNNVINVLFEQSQNAAQSTQDLLDLCSGKFPTQQMESQTQNSQNNDLDLVNNSDRLFLSDDDTVQDVLKICDNNISNVKEKKLKKKKNCSKSKILQYSDDEESGKENIEFESDVEEGVEKIYDYDSEENEIEVRVDKAEFEKEARTYFENEAELSESEWGSADEDERDLDKFEYEAGDADVLDDKKVRGELERIHIRQILDEDKREVRLLQELLLEDGENHGDATRERKFKWKNADNGFSLDTNPEDQEGDTGHVSDDEDQSEWRKQRFEREQVLREKQLKIDDIASSTGLLADSVGNETLSEKKTNLIVKRAIPDSSNIVMFHKEANFLTMDSIKKSYRGSFLKRDEASLSRLSALTRTNVEGQESTTLASTSKGNFVFSTLSPAQEKIPVEEKSRKRAPTEDINNISKKVKVKKPQASKKLLLDYLE